MTLDIEKIKALALDGDLYAVQELITRLEAVERELNLLKPDPLCDVGCMLSCSMEGNARLEAAEKDAAKWHEYQAKKKVLADRGFGKSPMRDMKESEK